ncbi:glycosyltransferase family 2 protein [Pedobacter deserti]|uniref:glycosyltransferase family 2 protein n=1 Tax=Pedobacter deserti TaxID=2817382 RepID=UPI00210A8438|nr:glycosyltransferase family 2 protein [Pedobacter sp. SYSU D00382]
MALISIVTVNYNQPQATAELLKSINLYYGQANIEIILVDNCSEKDHEADFRAVNDQIIYIRTARNLGFAGGNNVGIMRARGDYVFLVNNDTEFTSGLIETLVDTFSASPKIGMVSPRINYYDDKSIIQYAGFTPMNYYTCRNKCIGQYEADQGQHNDVIGPTGYVHGAAMMVSREALSKVGLLPENFFLYYEEMDWCEMMRRAGFDIWINTNALIYHKESLSVGRNSALKEYYMNRNRILFIRRNASWFHTLVFFVYFIIFVTPRNMLKYFKSGTPEFVPVLFRAIKWNLSNKPTSSYLGFKKTGT